MSPEENIELQRIYSAGQSKYESWDKLGKLTTYSEGLWKHVNDALNLEYIDIQAIKKRKLKVVADCVNGAGVYVIPNLLREFGCEVIEMNTEKTGIFPRLPEPLPENLTETMKVVKQTGADLAVVVDPDVDRLVLITEKGEPFGEENTITQAVKFILSKKKGNVAVNLSTTRAVDDVAGEFGCQVFRSPVGEANVVKKMIETGAIIGGEGSGGVIYPALHYGRDALVGIAITLQHLLEFGGTLGELKRSLPQYFIAKRKIELLGHNPDDIIKELRDKYCNEKINTEDGLKIDFADHWVHFRKSNTEPIIRCITEAKSIDEAERYIDKYFSEIKSFF
jgi:phosphomannomutase